MLLEIRRHIRRQTVADLTRYRGRPPLAVEVRLAQLDREWSVARAVKASVASIALHLRRSGLRSRTEIEAERRVLRIMKLPRA